MRALLALLCAFATSCIGDAGDAPLPGWPAGAFGGGGPKEPRWSETPRPWVIGHRGTGADRDREDFAENTVAAMIAAISVEGAVGVAIDVRLSRDARPVVLHDARLERTTSCSGCASHKTLAEILSCRTQGGGATSHPPALDEALRAMDALPVTPLVVVHARLDPLDPCGDSGATELASAIVGAIERARSGSFTWISGPAELVAAVRELHPQAGTLVSAASFERAAGEAVRTGARGVHVEAGLSREGVEQARRAGLLVDAGVVDAPIDLAAVVAWGVDIVETNDVPRVLASFR